MAKTIWEIKCYGLVDGDTAFAVVDPSGNTLFSVGDASAGGAFSFSGSETFKGLDWNDTTSGVDTLRVRGQLKVHDRGAPGTPDLFAVEIKSEYNATTGVHNCLEVTADWRADGTTGGTNRAVVGVSRVRAAQTLDGTANLIGTYGQIANSGTINGSGIHAALYGLIESGGTWTAVSHLASLWVDNHLAAAPGSGEMDMIYITNNAAAQVGQAFFIYAGDKITNLFKIDTALGMVGDTQVMGSNNVVTPGDFRLVKVDLEGDTLYMIAAASWTPATV